MADLLRYSMGRQGPTFTTRGISGSDLTPGSLATFNWWAEVGYDTDPILAIAAPSGVDDEATARAEDSYVAITITPVDGATMSLSRLTCQIARYTETDRTVFVRGSHDGYSANLWSGSPLSVRPTWDTTVGPIDIDLSGIAALQDTSQPWTVRIYCYPSMRVIDLDELTIAGSADLPSGSLAGYRVPMTLEVEHVLGAPTTARATYICEPATWPAALGDLFSVMVGTSVVATGVVDSMTRALAAPTSAKARYDVELVGMESIFQRRLFYGDYARDVPVSDIIDDLAAQALEDEDIDVGTIDGGSTTLFYPQFEHVPARVVLDELAAAIGGYWYIEPWPWALHLRTWGAVSAPWALSLKAPVWNVRVALSRGEYANMVYAINSSTWEYAVDPDGIDARATAEGGSGRYELAVQGDDDDDAADLRDFADRILALSNQFGYEIAYSTLSTNLRVGMEQPVDLPELGVPEGTHIRIERVVWREIAPGTYACDVTGRTHDLPATWERKWDKALMHGTYGAPRYWRP